MPHPADFADGLSVGGFVGLFADARFTPWGDDEPDFSASSTADTADNVAFEQGFAAGQAAAEAAFADDKAALLALATALDCLRPCSDATLAALLAGTVERLLRDCLGMALSDPALLREQAMAAAAALDAASQPLALRVNPDDLPLLAGCDLAVELVADAAIERGGLRLDTALGWIEDGPSVQLERLRLQLASMGARS